MKVPIAKPTWLREHKDRSSKPAEDRELPIEISGFDAAGEFFRERTATLEVSPGGCRFFLRTAVETKSVIVIRSLHMAERRMQMPSVLFQVVHTEPLELGSIVGASRLDNIQVRTVPTLAG